MRIVIADASAGQPEVVDHRQHLVGPRHRQAAQLGQRCNHGRPVAQAAKRELADYEGLSRTGARG